MGRHPLKKNYSSYNGNTINRIAPTIKYAQASKLADKNSRTIMKISQLMEIAQLPGHAEADPKDRIGSHISNLKSRLNRRLKKLAKWADSSADERHSEFKNSSQYPYKTLVKPMIYSKPTINPAKLLVPSNMISVSGSYGRSSFSTRSSTGTAIETIPTENKAETKLESNLSNQEETIEDKEVEDNDHMMIVDEPKNIPEEQNTTENISEEKLEDTLVQHNGTTENNITNTDNN